MDKRVVLSYFAEWIHRRLQPSKTQPC